MSHCVSHSGIRRKQNLSSPQAKRFDEGAHIFAHRFQTSGFEPVEASCQANIRQNHDSPFFGTLIVLISYPSSPAETIWAACRSLYNLGLALYGKCDLDGAIAEYRTARGGIEGWVEDHAADGSPFFSLQVTKRPCLPATAIVARAPELK